MYEVTLPWDAVRPAGRGHVVSQIADGDILSDLIDLTGIDVIPMPAVGFDAMPSAKITPKMASVTGIQRTSFVWNPAWFFLASPDDARDPQQDAREHVGGRRCD